MATDFEATTEDAVCFLCDPCQGYIMSTICGLNSGDYEECCLLMLHHVALVRTDVSKE
jgi:hypothetical protein